MFTWQKARVLAHDYHIPAGSTIWVKVGPPTWQEAGSHTSDNDETVVSREGNFIPCHIVGKNGEPYLCDVEGIELLPEFAETVRYVSLHEYQMRRERRGES